MNRLLLKILWNNQSKWQFIFAVTGFAMGLFIILSSFQIYLEIKNILFESEENHTANFVIINKQVTLANTFNKGQSAFTAEELDSIKMQPFIKSVSAFETATFSVQAKLQMQFGFSPDIFFEAVPDEYIDNRPEDFVWKAGNDFVPIIISNEFLNLYNFGVAMSSQLPQIPREAIQMFPFTILIFNKQKNLEFNARVIGFSDRIPTVLVPLSFMQWANKNYGKSEKPLPHRLLVEVNDNAAFSTFLDEKNYLTNKEQLKSDDSRKILNIVMSAVGFLGSLFVILSFVIFIVNFQLLIAKAKFELDVILNLGYTYAAISNVLNLQLAGILFSVLIGVLLLTQKLLGSITAWASEKGFELNDTIEIEVIIAGVAIVLLLMLLNNITLRWSLKK